VRAALNPRGASEIYLRQDLFRSYADGQVFSGSAANSPISQCTCFNVLKKTTTNFQVQHKSCDNGGPVNPDVNVSLDWIASSHN